jgi:hypothetical protein
MAKDMGFLDLVTLNCITNLSSNISINFSSKGMDNWTELDVIGCFLPSKAMNGKGSEREN